MNKEEAISELKDIYENVLEFKDSQTTQAFRMAFKALQRESSYNENYNFANKVVKTFSKDLPRKEYINEKGCPITGVDPGTSIKHENIINAFCETLEEETQMAEQGTKWGRRLTNEEAISDLYWISKNGYRADKAIIGTDRTNESLLMSIQALEKQIPKKVFEHFTRSDTGYFCCQETGQTIRYPLVSFRDLQFCPRCGQKID